MFVDTKLSGLFVRSYDIYFLLGRDAKYYIPGLKDLTYCQRLAKLKLDILELGRVRLYLMFTYKLVFDSTDLKLLDFFYCAVMPEVGDTHTNFSFQAAVQLQGTTTLLIGLHGLGITCQRTEIISQV